MSVFTPPFIDGATPIISLMKQATIVESGDALGGMGTTETIAVGDRFDGNIGAAFDQDWVRIQLEGGQRYVFTMFGTGGALTGLGDPELRVVNSNGPLVAFNDDIVGGYINLMSAVSFVAQTTGTYYIDARGNLLETGTYTIQTATDEFTTTRWPAI